MAVPIAVGVGPEPGEVDEATNSITVEAPTILRGISVVNSMISKKLTSHIPKLIVISRQLAEKGIERFMNTFMRYRKFQTRHLYWYINRFCWRGIEIFESSSWDQSVKHIELLMEAYQYAGFSSGTTIGEFYSRMECTCNEAVAILLGSSQIENEKDIENMFSMTSNTGGVIMEGDYEATDMPVIYESKGRQMGTAVFIKDKMVGELTGLETNYYLMVSGQIGAINYTLPEPNKKAYVPYSNYVSIRLTQARKPEINVKIEDENPVIRIKVSLEGDILSITGKEDYSMGEKLTELENYASDYIREEVLSFLVKTRDELKSDICATGKSIKKKFLYWDDWVSFNWPKRYEKADFNVELSVKIRRSGVMVKNINVDGVFGSEEK